MKNIIINLIDKFILNSYHKSNIETSEVINLLDQICEFLNLEHIYVCENGGRKNHYLYSYVSSKGPKSNTMHLNLIVFPESDIIHLVNMFEQSPVNICSNEITAARNATATNNLIYGFLDNQICTGFVSFQPYESDIDRVWTDDEKEIISRLALAINPLITKRQVLDRNAYEKNLSNSSSNLFWYYPKLSLIIIPEKTMERLIIHNFVYRNAPQSFTSEFIDEMLSRRSK